MTNTTNVPPPQFGPNGFVAPPESAILSGAQQDLNVVFNADLDLSLSTPQGQWASTETAIIGDANATFTWFTSQVDPAYSSGRMQDAIARIYFLERIPGAPTVQPCTCTGLEGVQISVGSLAVDPATGLQWICEESGTIPLSGSIVLNFIATQNGPAPGPGALNIYQAIFGWDTIVPLGDAALGVNVESRTEFEIRRSQSTAINATGHLPSILGAVLAVDNVLDAYVTENNDVDPQTVGGVTLNPHSLYACVLGGSHIDIATAIWSRKAPGCAYTGNTSLTVVDPSPQYAAPVPSYLVTFQEPDIITFAARVIIEDNMGIPATALAQIQNSLISGFAGADGGPRAKIGSTVLASRYYAGVLGLGSWAELVQIQLGRSGSVATIVGSISGTTLTVTSVSSVSIAAGQLLQGTGLPAGTTVLLVTQLTGSTNGTGTYTISITTSAISQTFSLSTLSDKVQMDIDEAPTIVAGTIYLDLV